MQERIVNSLKKFVGGSFVGTLIFFAVPAQSTPQPSLLATARNILVVGQQISPPNPDLQKLLTHQVEHFGSTNNHRSSSSSTDPLLSRLPLFGSARSAQTPPDKVPLALQLPLAQALVEEAFRTQLAQRFAIQSPSSTAIQQAVLALRIAPNTPLSSTEMQSLCNALGTHYALLVQVTNLKLYDGSLRTAIIHARLDVFGPFSNSPTPSEPIYIAGAAQIARIFLHSDYELTQADAIRLAALQTAQMGIHALETGQTCPFASPSAHVALLPIPAPNQAPAILFTPKGHIFRIGAHDLPSIVTELFTPNLLPLDPSAFCPPRQIDRALQSLSLSPTGLWQAEEPSLAVLQKLANVLKVRYLICVRVTDLELRSWRETHGEKVAQGQPVLEGAAEAVGYLVDTQDNRILWHQRTFETMQTTDLLSNSQAVHTVIRDATRFALSDLALSLRRYLVSYTRY